MSSKSKNKRRPNVAQMKPKQPQKDKVTKKEYFEGGKMYEGDARQISIKEAYNDFFDREILSYDKTGSFIRIKDMLEDLGQYKEDIELMHAATFDVLHNTKELLKELKKMVASLTLEDLEIDKKLLPTGSAIPSFKKDMLEKYYEKTIINEGMSPVDMANAAIANGIIDQLKKMLLEDAFKLSQLDD